MQATAIAEQPPNLPGIHEATEPETRPTTADESSMLDKSKSFAEQREQGIRKRAKPTNGFVKPPIPGHDRVAPVSVPQDSVMAAWLQDQRDIFAEELQATNPPPQPGRSFSQYLFNDAIPATGVFLAQTFRQMFYIAALLAVGFAMFSIYMNSPALIERLLDSLTPQPIIIGNGSAPAQLPRQVEVRLASLEKSVSSLAAVPQWTASAKSQIKSLETNQGRQADQLSQQNNELQGIRQRLSSPGAGKDTNSALRLMNFFSPKLGASIDPRLTSPTHANTLNWKQKLYMSLVWIPGPLPPAAVLEDWDEAADCWCAAASDKGKAQVGISIPYRVTPSKWTLEHTWKEGTFDISSAPKRIELWLQFSEEGAAKVRNARAEYLEGIATCSEPSGLDATFVCVGKALYDIDGPGHVQTFDLDVDLKSLHVASSSAVVRVTENYGQEWTCLYRVRLHGVIAGDDCV